MNKRAKQQIGPSSLKFKYENVEKTFKTYLTFRNKIASVLNYFTFMISEGSEGSDIFY